MNANIVSSSVVSVCGFCGGEGGYHNKGCNASRLGDWIQTYMGVQFWPLDPRQNEVRLLDIAHALSNICRFTGHCDKFYSVAEHSVRVSLIVPHQYAAWGLLHDSSEAYLGDLSRPLKRHSKIGEMYKPVEIRLMRVICEKFGLALPEPFQVKDADDVLLMTEKRDLMPNSPAKWREEHVKPLAEKIIPWSSEIAKHRFLQRAKELGVA